MRRQRPREAGGGGDEGYDGGNAGDVAFFALEDLGVDAVDDATLLCLVVSSGEGFQNAEAIDDAAGGQFDGAAVVPLLQFAHGGFAGDTGGGSGEVDVDMGVFQFGFAVGEDRFG